MSSRRFIKIMGLFPLILALVILAQFGTTTNAAMRGEGHKTQGESVTPTPLLFQLIPHNEENICGDEIKEKWFLPGNTKKPFIPTILRRSCFKFDSKQIQLSPNLESVVLPLFSHTSIEFHPAPPKPIPDLLKRNSSSQFKESNTDLPPYSWTGRITKVNGLKETGTVVLIVDKSRQTIEGIIRYGTTLIRIQPLTAGLHAVVEIDTTRFPDEADPEEAYGTGQTESAHTTEFLSQTTRSFQTVSENDSALSEESDCPTAPYPVDIAVFYTAKAMSEAGGTPEAFERQLRLTIGDANSINEINEIPIRLNLVWFEATTYEEKEDLQDDLNNLTSGDDPSGLSHRAADLRDQKKADLVSLFVGSYEDYCGMGKPNDWSNLSPAKAYSVVVQRCSANHLSMLHEFGHNMGAKHESSSSPTGNEIARGHRSESAKQYTLMARKGACATCERIPYWSTPDYTYINREEKRGDEGADNTTALRTVACQVSKFK